MSSRRPDLDDLDLLVLVSRTGSIGRAAVLLGLTQPSVSRRMAALERSLRVSLLSRGRRGTELTPAGRVVVNWAASLLDAASDFSASVQTLREQSEVTVRAAVSMTIAEHYAPGWLSSLRRRQPDVVVSLTVANSTEVSDLVEKGTVDIGFIESPTLRTGLRSHRVGHDVLAVAVTPDHYWTTRESISAEELSRSQLLVREPGSGTRETVEQALLSLGLEMTTGLELASNTALKSAARAGMGPAVVSALSVCDELANGHLVDVAVDGLQLQRPLSAVWRSDHDLSPATVEMLAIAGTKR
ncbi:MAG TPA: LysR family transcriptional regulator [Nocardioidaceae bacterium]|nr:LysR family transcriptional regulator [Nocardioidaceae bacterium]